MRIVNGQKAEEDPAAAKCKETTNIPCHTNSFVSLLPRIGLLTGEVEGLDYPEIQCLPIAYLAENNLGTLL